jgi:hypothetical protein
MHPLVTKKKRTSPPSSSPPKPHPDFYSLPFQPLTTTDSSRRVGDTAADQHEALLNATAAVTGSDNAAANNDQNVGSNLPSQKPTRTVLDSAMGAALNAHTSPSSSTYNSPSYNLGLLPALSGGVGIPQNVVWDSAMLAAVSRQALSASATDVSLPYNLFNLGPGPSLYGGGVGMPQTLHQTALDSAVLAALRRQALPVSSPHDYLPYNVFNVGPGPNLYGGVGMPQSLSFSMSAPGGNNARMPWTALVPDSDLLLLRSSQRPHNMWEQGGGGGGAQSWDPNTTSMAAAAGRNASAVAPYSAARRLDPAMPIPGNNLQNGADHETLLLASPYSSLLSALPDSSNVGTTLNETATISNDDLLLAYLELQNRSSMSYR